MNEPARGAIRQTPTGMEGYCYLCARIEQPDDCWHPLTPQFFPLKRRKDGLVRYEPYCIACAREQQAARQARYRERLREAA